MVQVKKFQIENDSGKKCSRFKMFYVTNVPREAGPLQRDKEVISSDPKYKESELRFTS